MASALAAVAAPAGSAWAAIAARHETALAAMARLVGTTPDRVTTIPSTSAGIFPVASACWAGRQRGAARSRVPRQRVPLAAGRGSRGPGGAPGAPARPAGDGRAPRPGGGRRDPGGGGEPGGLRHRVPRRPRRTTAAPSPAPLLVVDAIQGLGAVAAVLGPADVLVAGGQKWLRAGWGSGVMAVGDRALERLAPTLTGWCGVEALPRLRGPAASRDAGRRRAVSRRALRRTSGTLQMGAAVEVIEMAGIAAIEAAVLARAAAVEEACAGPGPRCSLPGGGPRSRRHRQLPPARRGPAADRRPPGRRRPGGVAPLRLGAGLAARVDAAGGRRDAPGGTGALSGREGPPGLRWVTSPRGRSAMGIAFGHPWRYSDHAE